MEVASFIMYGPVQNRYYFFLDGQYYAAKTTRGNIDVDSWTGKAKMIPKNFQRYCIQPTRLLDRKIMLYPDPKNKSSPSFFLVIDPEYVDTSDMSVHAIED